MEFSIKDKKITVFGSEEPGVPVVYLNTVHGEGEAVWEACRKKGCPPFTLAAISGLLWEQDMSPWAVPPISPNDMPFTGGADDYLTLLTSEIVPAVENELAEKPSVRALAGYSLAGLFALYAAYRTVLFTKIASVSGSLWFPDFTEYVFSHQMKAELSGLYLSLGDKEAKTRNPYLRMVQKNTEQIAAHYKEQGLYTIFEQNPGNHFQNPNERTAAGIAWILKEMTDTP